jgi:hypothetical protein
MIIIGGPNDEKYLLCKISLMSKVISSWICIILVLVMSFSSWALERYKCNEKMIDVVSLTRCKCD